MIFRTSLMTAAVAAVALLGGCVYPDTRADYGSNFDRGRNDNGYNDDYRGNYRQTGVVTDVERVSTRRGGGTSGGGAVLGAIIGGVLGNQVGKGDGRKAATVAGAVAGGFAGNAVEGRNDRNADAWRIYVDLDDGRSATVTQSRNPGLRRGDRVQIRNQQVEFLR
ncbi:MAG: glycine zipper 2TM domain-containing protein [Dokdonella sp.]